MAKVKFRSTESRDPPAGFQVRGDGRFQKVTEDESPSTVNWRAECGGAFCT